jgi:hypothetical protein
VELTLNLVWLLISAAVLILCYSRSAISPGRRGRVIAALAMVCVACLLFPVISMTDDLNSSPALPEGNKFKNLAFSGSVIIALAAWIMLNVSREKSWWAFNPESSWSLPSQQLPAYSLQHRPPPPVSIS